MHKKATFDEIFNIWLDSEANQIEGRNILPVAKAKGFNSVAEWRLSTALRLGMDTKIWSLEIIENPNETLPNIIIGPYQGWSKFFNNQLQTSFAEALKYKEFSEWCKTHDRIIPISNNFPLPTTIILFRKPNGDLMHIEGGHRICAVAYKKSIGSPIDFENKPSITAAIANVTDSEIAQMLIFLKEGTFKI
ncbi:MAG: hypothetical protein JWO40_745 [Candidatus Doudnabacteria bacterium]|nr:hypothetical protein [Candidatus Doudnabacteria bacterium]